MLYIYIYIYICVVKHRLGITEQGQRCGEVSNLHKSTTIHLIRTVYLALCSTVISQFEGFSCTLRNTAAREVLLSFVLRFLRTVIPFTCNASCEIARTNQTQNVTLPQVMAVLLVILPQMSDPAGSDALVYVAV